MDAGAKSDNNPDGVEEVFNEFMGRRAGIIKALTTEVDEFFQKCDPEKDNLCLYGFPDETWDVMLPSEGVPPDIPDPVLGINFARDGMASDEWLSFVAEHSDSWLLSVAFYLGTYVGLNKSDRLRLFDMINDLPTILEIVNEASKQQTNKKEEEDELEDETICSICNKQYSRDEFWICCDVCDTWYHGKCVKVTQDRAVYIKKYRCPSC